MEIKTLLFSLFAINLFMSLFLYAIKRSQHIFRGVNFWIVSTVFIAIGYLMLALRDSIPFVISVLCSQYLFFIGGFARIYGLDYFFNKPVSKIKKISSAIFTILFILLILYFTVINENILARTLIMGVSLSFLSVVAGIKIYNNKPIKGNFTYKFTAFIFHAFALIFILRIISWMFFPSIRHLFANSYFNSIQFFTNMIIDIAWSIMFFVIHNQKLALDTKESEEKYRSIFNNSISGIVLFNKEGKYLDINPQYSKITGYSYPEIEQKSVGFITHPDDLVGLQNALKDLLSQKIVAYKNQLRIIHKNGQTVWLQLNATTNFKQDGTFEFVLVEAYDITLQKIAEQELKESEAKLKEQVLSKDKFMSILAHDLKSPFNGILGFSDLLLDNLHNYSIKEIEEQLKLINASSYKTFQLLEDLLLWSQSQSGKLSFQPEIIEVKGFFSEIISQKQMLADAKKIRLNCDIPENISLVADPNMLKTILRNLISNAIKYTHEKGEITIHIEKESDKAMIVISDNGIGIDKENLGKLWDLSFQYSTTGTAGEKGTGFGLLLCKDFVEKQGGKIWVESEFGKGCDFKFTLPLILE